MSKTSTSNQLHKVKHVPQRTCIACRREDNKRMLVRVVRLTDGHVEVDETGKKSGRGAYLCKDPNCWNEGLKGNRLEHVLRIKISTEDRQGLVLYSETL